MNRLNPEYRKRVQHAVILRRLKVVARLRDEATEPSGLKYGDVRVSPEMAMALMEVAMEQPPEGMM